MTSMLKLRDKTTDTSVASVVAWVIISSPAAPMEEARKGANNQKRMTMMMINDDGDEKWSLGGAQLRMLFLFQLLDILLP